MKRLFFFFSTVIFFCFFCIPAAALNNSGSEAKSVSVTDGRERIVTVKKKPERIISLAPASTEILFAIGAQNQIAAVTDFCDYPPEAENLPSVGGFDGKTFSIEKLLSFRPDLVYAYAGMHDHLIEPLERFGIPVYVSNAVKAALIPQEIRKIGLLTGHTGEAEEIALTIENDFRLLENAAQQKKRPSVYWELWNSPYMSAGKNSFLDDIIRLAGGENIFSDTLQAYPVVSEESIIARNPQIILLPADSPVKTASVSDRNGWRLVEAVKNGSVYVIDADLLSRPGPRIAEAVKSLAELLKN